MTEILRARTQGVLLAALAALALTLSGCSGSVAGDAGAGASEPSDDGVGAGDSSADSAEESPGGDLVVLPGTGRYVLGTEAPYGGYQLTGEPSEMPAGCTWSLEDDDGAVAFENNGQYVFLTEIPEVTVFVTNGCPDWEQFE